MRHLTAATSALLALTLSACGGGGGGDGGNGSDDSPIELRIDNAQAAESAGELRFPLSLSRALDSDLTIAVTATGDSATAGEDYASIPATLTIPAGVTSTSLSVSLLDDGVVEASEQFTVTLSDPDQRVTTQTLSATGTIEDDDQLHVSVAAASALESDDGGLHFTVSLSAAAQREISLDYSSSDGSAAAASDYSAASDSLQIAAGETSAQIDIALLDDFERESSETFQLHISSADSQVLVDTADVTGTIEDDESLPLEISLLGASAAEDSGELRFTARLNRATQQEQRVDYSVRTDGSAASDDLITASGTLVIPAREQQASIPVTITTDAVLETDETFSVTLSNPRGELQIDTASATGTIENDDTAHLTLVADASVTEGGLLRFTASLQPAAETTVSADYNVGDITTSGDDYSDASGRISLAAGETSTVIEIKTIDDTLLESDEQLRLALSAPSAGLTLGEAATGTIANDDSATLSVNAAAPASEGGGAPLLFTLSLDAAAAIPVALRYESLADSATPGVDFSSVGADIEIPAGQTEVTVAVPLLDDDRVEGSEQLRLSVSSDSSDVQVSNSPAAGEISDDDSVSIEIATPAPAAEADGELLFAVELSDSADIDLDIGYRSLDPTTGDAATAGDDYTAADARLTIPAGETTAEIRIAINDDTVVERDEQLDVELHDPAAGIALGGTPGSALASGVISNDDSYNITVENAENDENAGTLDFVVKLDQAALDELTLRYSSSDGSATAGTDYSAASAQTTTIAAGSDSATISLALIDDTESETSEDLNLQVELLAIDGSVASSVDATGLIQDDDAVAISTSDMSALEGISDSVTVTVRIARAESVLVNYSTENLTASAGNDYSEISGTLDFNGGITELDVEIPILDDGELEGNERFLLRLSNPSANAMLAVETATVTIDDNDDSELNDTGVALCSNASDNLLPCNDAEEGTSTFPGQDAEHGRDTIFDDDSDGRAGFSFTKLDGNGDSLPADASSWDCVYDNVTGLTWEVKQDNGLHDADDTFSWYNPRSSENGGDAGTRNGGNCQADNCDTEGFVDAVNAAELCGYDDWRMPTPLELRSLADLSVSRLNMPAIDSDYFPGTDHGYPATKAEWRYWTGVPQVSSPVNNAWSIAFDDGHETPGAKSDDYHLRLVRD